MDPGVQGLSEAVWVLSGANPSHYEHERAESLLGCFKKSGWMTDYSVILADLSIVEPEQVALSLIRTSEGMHHR